MDILVGRDKSTIANYQALMLLCKHARANILMGEQACFEYQNGLGKIKKGIDQVIP